MKRGYFGAGFMVAQNIAVHEYEMIDVEILKSILQHHFKDIEDFYTVVLEYFDLV